ncbi:hypothetical protein [Actinophytocola sp. NPDC049390]|uniref:hypothetical protein n=1 Tax=Actinophytocola sp. NPDC049390 TaxID=3363894 RepID=UPI0037B14AEB
MKGDNPDALFVSTISVLPATPAGSDDDEAHGMVRILSEDIANSEIDAAEESHRLQVLATVDQLPVTQRTELGRLLLNNLDIARNVDDDREVRWQFRVYQFPSPAPQVGFGVCSRLDEATRAGFRAWLLLRHHEHGTHGGDLAALMSVGVLLTPRHDGYRDWDPTALAHRVTVRRRRVLWRGRWLKDVRGSWPEKSRLVAFPEAPYFGVKGCPVEGIGRSCGE